MTDNDLSQELSDRIQADIDHFAGGLPERNAIAWRGYLAAMLEWNQISTADYEGLLSRLPPVEDDPSVAILRGRD
jgi:hypothetical protein